VTVHKSRVPGRHGEKILYGGANICESSVGNWLHGIILAPRILRWLLNFFKNLCTVDSYCGLVPGHRHFEGTHPLHSPTGSQRVESSAPICTHSSMIKVYSKGFFQKHTDVSYKIHILIPLIGISFFVTGKASYCVKCDTLPQNMIYYHKTWHITTKTKFLCNTYSHWDVLKCEVPLRSIPDSTVFSHIHN